MVTNLGDGSRGRGVAIKAVGDLLDRHHAVRVKQEDRQDGALPRAAKLDRRRAATGGLDRPEDAETDRHAR